MTPVSGASAAKTQAGHQVLSSGPPPLGSKGSAGVEATKTGLRLDAHLHTSESLLYAAVPGLFLPAWAQGSYLQNPVTTTRVLTLLPPTSSPTAVDLNL